MTCSLVTMTAIPGMRWCYYRRFLHGKRNLRRRLPRLVHCRLTSSMILTFPRTIVLTRAVRGQSEVIRVNVGQRRPRNQRAGRIGQAVPALRTRDPGVPLLELQGQEGPPARASESWMRAVMHGRPKHQCRVLQDLLPEKRRDVPIKVGKARGENSLLWTTHKIPGMFRMCFATGGKAHCRSGRLRLRFPRRMRSLRPRRKLDCHPLSALVEVPSGRSRRSCQVYDVLRVHLNLDKRLC